jgi:hypothetical protein
LPFVGDGSYVTFAVRAARSIDDVSYGVSLWAGIEDLLSLMTFDTRGRLEKTK